MKVVAVHQPNYIPWLGYFYKINISDVFVILNDVQFIKDGGINYNNIKTPQGAFRLKIPVDYKMGQNILDVRTKDELGWKKKHLKTIENFYRKAPFFDEVFSDFKAFLIKEYNNIGDLNERIIVDISQKLGIKTQFVHSSDLNISTQKEERILDICEGLNATIYLSGRGAKAYQNPKNFEKRGIYLKYTSFKTFNYPQLFGEFADNMSILDYLMNCGYDWQRVMESQKRVYR